MDDFEAAFEEEARHLRQLTKRVPTIHVIHVAKLENNNPFLDPRSDNESK